MPPRYLSNLTLLSYYLCRLGMCGPDCCCRRHRVWWKILRNNCADLVCPGFICTRYVLICDQRNLYRSGDYSRGHMLFWYKSSRATTTAICGPQCGVSSTLVWINNHIFHFFRLCIVVIIALPVVTPSKYRNRASYVLGDFTNRES